MSSRYVSTGDEGDDAEEADDAEEEEEVDEEAEDEGESAEAAPEENGINGKFPAPVTFLLSVLS